MATLQCIVFFLACAFLLQEIHTQKSNFHYTEESSSSSSSSNKKENFKKEIKLVNDKANAVMVTACGVMKKLNLECSVGAMKRKFLASFALDIAKKFVDMNIRMLYAIVYLCEKLVKCINMVIEYIVNALISALPPCTQKRLRTIKEFFKVALELITKTLKIVYNFAKDVTSCALSLGECIKSVFGRVFQTVMEIFRNILQKTTETVTRVFRLSKDCPVPEQKQDPEPIIIRFGTCFFCSFKPNAGMCG